MTPISYDLITPQKVYAGLATITAETPRVLEKVILDHTPSGNSYIDLFANLIRTYGKRPAPWYAKLLGADKRQFDGAIRCMTGISSHNWINEYLRLVAGDLLEHTQLTFKEIGKLMGMSSSSFSQFFQAYQHMQPWEYRSLKQQGLKNNYFFE